MARKSRKHIENPAVSEIPLLTLQIDPLHVELERLEEIHKMLNARISALCGQSAFESLMKHQLLQIVVSGRVVSEVIFLPTEI